MNPEFKAFAEVNKYDYSDVEKTKENFIKELYTILHKFEAEIAWDDETDNFERCSGNGRKRNC